MKWIQLLIPALLLGTTLFANVKVIVHKDSPASELSASDLKKMYLNKKQGWDHGGKVDLITLKRGPVLDAFLNAYIQKSSSQFNRFWKKMVFTGRGIAPQKVSSDADMVEAISKNRDAIGFVSESADTAEVKVLLIQ